MPRFIDNRARGLVRNIIDFVDFIVFRIVHPRKPKLYKLAHDEGAISSGANAALLAAERMR